MERLTERKTPCWIKTKSGKDYTNYTQDWDSINKLAGYEDMEELLEKVYGECDGLLETAIEHLVKHPEAENGNPGKARLLTDDDADKWERWKNAEKQGRLLELPYAVRDILYMPYNGKVICLKVEIIRIYDEAREIQVRYVGTDMSLKYWGFSISEIDIGHTIFITREEAEARLKEMEDIEETVQNLISEDVPQTAGTGWKDIIEEALNKGSGD